MKRIIYIHWLIFCFLVNVSFASESIETNLQNVKREIEFKEIKNDNEEPRIVNLAAINILETGIAAIGSSICSIDLKLVINGLNSREQWAISSKIFTSLMIFLMKKCYYVLLYTNLIKY